MDRNSPSSLISAVDTHLLETVGVAPAQATPTELMQAVAQVAREQLSRRWVATQRREQDEKARRVYYLSIPPSAFPVVCDQLSSSGLAQFTHAGRVTGDTSVRI